MSVIETKRVPFRVDTPAVKSTTSKDGTIILRGYANTWNEDRDGETVAKDAFDGSLEAYLALNPMVLYQHNPDWPIGKVSEGGPDKAGLGVSVEIDKPMEGEIPEVVTAYRAIEAGTLRTFSIGGFMQKTIEQAKRIISKVELLEISVVTIPANPDSVFVAASKALNGEPMSELSPLAKSQMEQLLGFRPMSDPELLGMSTEQIDDHWEALTDLFKSVYGSTPPPRDAWLKVKRAKEGGVAVAIVAKAGVEVVRSFYQPKALSLEAIEKGGRAISSSNEAKLKKAKGHIDEVLATVAPPPVPSLASDWQDGEPLDSALNPPNAVTQHMSASATRAKARDGKTYEDLRAAIKAALVDELPSKTDDDGNEYGPYVWVEDFSDTWAVYESQGHLYQVPYTRDTDNNVVLGDAVEVRPVTTYVELAVEFDHEGTPFVDTGAKGSLPVRQLPMAADDTPWNLIGLQERIKAWAGAEDAPNGKFAQAFLWREGSGTTFAEYSMPVADVVDGELKYVPAAIAAAAENVKGDESTVKSTVLRPKLDILYGKLGAEQKPPWAED